MTKRKPKVRKLPDGLTTASYFAKGYRLKSYYLPLLKTAAPSYQIIRFGRRISSGINSYGTNHINFLDSGFLQQMYTELIANPGSANQRAFIESIRVEIEICNAGDQICTLELYDIACTKDTLNDPETAMIQGLATMNPSVAGGQSAAQSILSTSLGFTPFNSPQFAQFFKIDKMTKIAIPLDMFIGIVLCSRPV
jgi:hypothetical protein